jgi:hypothetical protein
LLTSMSSLFVYIYSHQAMHANNHMERGSAADRFILDLRDDPAISYIALYQDSLQSSQRMQVFTFLFLRSGASLALFSTSQCFPFLEFCFSSLARLFNGRLAKSKSLVRM